MKELKDIDFDKTMEGVVEGLPDMEDDTMISSSMIYHKLPFSWGIPIIDKKLGLIDRNRLVIIAGEGGSGKTTYTMQQAIANARNGYKVAYMSLEMGKKSLVTFIAKKRAGIARQITYDQDIEVTKAQEIAFDNEVSKLTKSEGFEIIGYKSALDVNLFIKEIERLSKGYDMVFVDNLGMVSRGGKETDTLPLLTHAMMKARQNHEVTIVALHHMNKGSETQSGPRGKNAIRGSGKILDDADKIITITRTELGTNLRIVKDRDDGIMTEVELVFDRGEFISDDFE